MYRNFRVGAEVLLCGVFALGCATKGGSVVQGRPGGASGGGDTTGNGAGGGLMLNVDGGNPVGDGGVGAITITPTNPVLTVTVTNGVVTRVTGGSDSKGTLTFQAMSGGVPVVAKWSIDRGELGTLN